MILDIIYYGEERRSKINEKPITKKAYTVFRSYVYQ